MSDLEQHNEYFNNNFNDKFNKYYNFRSKTESVNDFISSNK